MAITTFGPDTVVFREGESGDTFYQVLTGKVNALIHYGTDKEQKLTELGPGDFFGEIAMLGAYPRTATIVTGGAGATLMELTWDAMLEVFKANPSIILALMQHIGRRTAALSADCDEAYKTLNAIKAANAEPVAPSLLDKARMLVSYVFGSKAGDGPSLEEKMGAAGDRNVSEGFSKYVFSADSGDILYREGDPASCMYTIHSGSVGVNTIWQIGDRYAALAQICIFNAVVFARRGHDRVCQSEFFI